MASLPLDPRFDVVVLLQALTRLAAEQVLLDLADHDVRESDGYVFQHLVGGPRAVTELAGLLGISQQAASKAVVDLERRGHVERLAHPDDARVRLVGLTTSGAAAVEAGRRARAALVDRFVSVLGERRLRQLAGDLETCIDTLGGMDALRGRRLRPPS